MIPEKTLFVAALIGLIGTGMWISYVILPTAWGCGNWKKAYALVIVAGLIAFPAMLLALLTVHPLSKVSPYFPYLFGALNSAIWAALGIIPRKLYRR